MQLAEGRSGTYSRRNGFESQDQTVEHGDQVGATSPHGLVN